MCASRQKSAKIWSATSNGSEGGVVVCSAPRAQAQQPSMMIGAMRRILFLSPHISPVANAYGDLPATSVALHSRLVSFRCNGPMRSSLADEGMRWAMDCRQCYRVSPQEGG